MKKKSLFKNFKSFELSHKIGFFILIMFLTILLIRIIVLIKNPNPFFLNFEIHHFDYGILLLVITILLLLFGEKKYSLHLILSAISIGLIIDDYWFIRSNFNDPSNIEEILLYNNSFPLVLVFSLIIILLIFLIKFYKRKSK